ncbi:MAG: nucleotidyltransferase domain-containing protein [Erysipelotrichaceae bacterium]|nr:nucleotidyltransferase domain-containing protein [Erysipelotrichaceae bacterium]
MRNLKQYRKQLGISAKQAASDVGIPLRTYLRYEDNDYGNHLKRQAIISLLDQKYEINEDKGLLSIPKIQTLCFPVLEKYRDSISFCYLFGSYAKGYENEGSDIDLCIATTLTGLAFVGFVEELKSVLKKRLDVIRLNDLKDNFDLLSEIMKDGIKIYG